MKRPPPALAMLLALDRVAHSLDGWSKALSARDGVSAEQRLVLRQLHRAPGSSLAALAASLHRSPSTVGALLRPLEAQGLVARRRNRLDRRALQFSVTPFGAALATRTRDTPEGALRRALAAVDAGQQLNTVQLIEGLADALDAALSPGLGSLDPG
ncbi:MAG: MarR family transcriptional regulator [Myxococcales bacterium]|nr:MarR family transcriptional regulator [Myxococcales bacterium]